MQTNVKEKIKRVCVVCGKNIVVTLNTDLTYFGGHYFQMTSLETEKNPEYWECDICYDEKELADVRTAALLDTLKHLGPMSEEECNYYNNLSSQ